MDSFGAYPVFVTVIEMGGFSPAAIKLGISKSAVSKRITQLEEHLGVKLLHRTTRKLSLTEAGEYFYHHARIASQAAQDAEDAVAQLQGDPQGRLRISIPMSFGRMYIAPIVPEFLRRYPKISLELVLDDKFTDLIGDGFDLAVRLGDLKDSSLVAKKLTYLRNILCASPEYLSANGIPVRLEDLKQHNCLAFSYSQDVREWYFSKNNVTRAIEISGNYQVNNSEALREAMIQGVGIGRLPSFVANPEIKAGRLVSLFDEYEMPGKSMYAVYSQRQFLPAKVRVFINFMAENFGEAIPFWDKNMD
ncbi:LysR family transcriptional regulator [Oleiphilus messinensis]|uniref:LysR family transcriptional regulator n=1 Tax=Oleiphilus messinensis TaxID=141451 RepID=A0A1Y0IF61_9GAMM|nr:LysR family transcriptional regulator [Oleiphilus messinensis]ARU59178.1 LysR family transcriptional regulator [Oleiphilus messinensis]